MESSILTEVFLPLALGVIMLGMGLTLTVGDFKRIVIYPKAVAIGFYGARLLRLSPKQSGTVSIESGIQNGTLGITVAATLIGNSQMTIPSAIYSLIMFATAVVVIYIGNRTIKD